MPSSIFSIVNIAAMVMWFLLVFLPRWKVTKFLIQYKFIPIALAIVYVIFIVQSLLAGVVLDFGSLNSVKTLFTNENLLLAGWIHYLVFDLLIGMWILDQNKNLGINNLFIALCLIFTFMLGPIGYLLFILFKNIKTKQS